MKKENGLKNILLIFLIILIKTLNQQKHQFNIGLIVELQNLNYKVIFLIKIRKRHNFT